MKAWCLALALAACAVAAPVSAQQITLEPSVVAACLTPTDPERVEPAYPFVHYKSNEHGRVKVRMRFARSDLRPTVEVLESEGGDAFVEAVRNYLRTLRLPCLPSGQVAELVQEYAFSTDSQRVYWNAPSDTQDAARAELLKCMLHTSGSKSPDYPWRAQRDQVQGRVLARLRFQAADQPPKADIVYRKSARELAEQVEKWVQGYRLPCRGDEDISLSIVFVFQFEGLAFGFKALTLGQVLRSAKAVGDEHLALDTSTMGCPLNLKFGYFQPHGINQVGVVGAPNPAAQTLIDWLKTVQLDLRESQLDAVFADTTDLAVPCIQLDLKPKG